MDGPVESTAGATRAAASTVPVFSRRTRNPDGVSLLADVVARFASAWEAPGDGTPPDLEYFLPGGLPVGDALRRAALVELIKVDLEYRLLRADRPRSLASYCEEFPELRSKPLPPDLLYEDFHLRRRGGHTVDVAEYAREFPEHADRLTDVLDGAGDYRRTSSRSRARSMRSTRWRSATTSTTSTC